VNLSNLIGCNSVLLHPDNAQEEASSIYIPAALTVMAALGFCITAYRFATHFYTTPSRNITPSVVKTEEEKKVDLTSVCEIELETASTEQNHENSAVSDSLNFPVDGFNDVERSIVRKWQEYRAKLKKSKLEGKEFKDQYGMQDEIRKELFLIISRPFNSCSPEFYNFLKSNNRKIIKEIYGKIRYRVEKTSRDPDILKVFFLVESYLRDKTPESIERIESYLKKVRQEDFDVFGIEILRPALADGLIVRNVYRSGDKDLIQLFRTYLPKPGVDLFERDGGSVPDFIVEEARKADATINTLAQIHGIETLERYAIAIQRKVRARQRREREFLRVMEQEAAERDHAKWAQLVAKKMAGWHIRSGNRPYMPKCEDRALAERIFNAAYLVPNHPKIRHITAAQSLPKILDGCLYGRQSLAMRYISFRPAALSKGDQKNGDANVICFGPQKIDDQAWKDESVEIVLDLKKFRETRSEKLNPCVFFKQQDLGYDTKEIRTVKISQDISIRFNHTSKGTLIGAKENYQDFILYSGATPIAGTKVFYQRLISSNFESMTAIQTLNFFRYLDAISWGQADAKSAIYNKIAQLDDQQLVNFLAQLHIKMTDTAEFNFYGAYKIDLESIESIIYVPDKYSEKVSLRLSELIDSLNVGDPTLYNEMREKMPFLFESKRFMNFLRSKIMDPDVLGEISESTTIQS